MLLSEKASAFFIENLISKASSSSTTSTTVNPKKHDQNNNINSDESSSSVSNSLSIGSSDSSFLTNDNTNPLISPSTNNNKKSLKSSYEYHIKQSNHKSPSSSCSSTSSQLSDSAQSSSASPQLSPRSSPNLYSPNKIDEDESSSIKNPKKRKLFSSSCDEEDLYSSQNGGGSKNKHNKLCSASPLPPQISQNHHLHHYEMNSITKAKIEICKYAHSDLNQIECYLETDDLWKKFYELGTEMIITKSGRRMFPPLRVSFLGAKMSQKYVIAMDIVPTDNKRYRYAYHRSSWLVAGKADPPVQSRLYVHPDGPFTGDTLYKQIVSFEKVKLTNNEMDKSGHVSFFIVKYFLKIFIYHETLQKLK
jgi:hypothetical protein